jgi:hypothetical protein
MSSVPSEHAYYMTQLVTVTGTVSMKIVVVPVFQLEFAEVLRVAVLRFTKGGFNSWFKSLGFRGSI